MALGAMRVPTVFTAVDRFSSVIDRMTRNVSTFGNASEGAARRIGSKMTRLGNSMMITSASMMASLAVPLNKAVEFEDQMASIATLLPELNSKGIRQIGDDILNMATKTSTPIKELTTSYYDLISAGVANKDAMSWLKSADTLSIAGLGTLVESTNIELAAMRNFSKDFKNTDEAANALFKTIKYGKTTVSQLSEAFASNAVFAGGLGVTGQEYMAAIASITTTTLPTSMAETAIGGLSNAISKTTDKKNKVLFSLFKKMNVGSGEELLKDKGGFMPALMAIKDEADKAKINLESIFGLKQASTAFIMLTKNQKVLEKYGESLKSIGDKSEDALSVSFIKKQATGKFGLGVLNNNMNALAITMGTTLIPALNDLLKDITPIVKQFTSWVKLNPGAITGFAKLAAGIGAFGLVISGIGTAIKIAGWYKWIASINWAGTTVEALYVTFDLLAAMLGMSAGGLFGTIAAGAWVIYDMIDHWRDWARIALLLLGPLGKVAFALNGISKRWDVILDSFQNKGIIAGISEIGSALRVEILSTLDDIVNIIGRIPIIGSFLNDFSAKIEANFANSMGVSGMNEATGFGGINGTPVFGGVIPNPIGGFNKTENLAGKNKNTNNQSDIEDALSKMKFEFSFKGEKSEMDGFKVNGKTMPSGIPAKTESNTGIKK